MLEAARRGRAQQRIWPAISFEFSCKEGVKDPATVAKGLGASSNVTVNTAMQAAEAGMTANRGAASAADTSANHAMPPSNHTKTAGLSASAMLERLKDIAETLASLLQNPHVEELYSEFAFHPDVRVTRSMGILCIRVSFSLRPEADLFQIQGAGITKDTLFSSRKWGSPAVASQGDE